MRVVPAARQTRLSTPMVAKRMGEIYADVMNAKTTLFVLVAVSHRVPRFERLDVGTAAPGFS